MKRILTIQLKRLGDLVLNTAALGSLRQVYPGSRITLIIDQYSAELAPAIEGVDEFWVYRRNRSLPLWVRLSGTRFDGCVDFTGNDRAALMVLLSKASRRAGLRRPEQRRLRNWIYNAPAYSSVRDLHTVDLYLNLVRRLEPKAIPAEPALRLPANVLAGARSLLQDLGIRNAYFVVQAGTARAEKLWPAESWATVIAEAHRRSGLPCLLTGGRESAELKHAETIRSAIASRAPCIVLAGKTDLLLTCALIRQATFFLGVDSVGAHLAAVFKRPELVLFGPTNPFHWRPRHPGGRVVRAGFGPDYEPLSPTEPGQPMTALSTDTVIRAMGDLCG
ncbi:MAG: glycosyltransferase family 9 protein [Verrucomicrobia bacterium]|nr:glycosyltransferase family 9 protein [Verrucomicrobiota bacterium]